ncbi:unnamed protein product, partial [Pleuronectes platessa]
PSDFPVLLLSSPPSPWCCLGFLPALSLLCPSLRHSIFLSLPPLLCIRRPHFSIV